MNKNPSCH